MSNRTDIKYFKNDAPQYKAKQDGRLFIINSIANYDNGMRQYHLVDLKINEMFSFDTKQNDDYFLEYFEST